MTGTASLLKMCLSKSPTRLDLRRGKRGGGLELRPKVSAGFGGGRRNESKKRGRLWHTRDDVTCIGIIEQEREKRVSGERKRAG